MRQLDRVAIAAVARATHNSPPSCAGGQGRRSRDSPSRARPRSRIAAMPSASARPHAKSLSAHRIGLSKSIPIRVLMAAVMARKLAIDVGDDSSLRGAGKFICGNNLIAKSSQRRGLRVAEELPGPRLAAGLQPMNHRSRSSLAAASKLPARQKDAPLASPHRLAPRNRCTRAFKTVAVHNCVSLSRNAPRSISMVGLCFESHSRLIALKRPSLK